MEILSLLSTYPPNFTNGKKQPCWRKKTKKQKHKNRTQNLSDNIFIKLCLWQCPFFVYAISVYRGSYSLSLCLICLCYLLFLLIEMKTDNKNAQSNFHNLRLRCLARVASGSHKEKQKRGGKRIETITIEFLFLLAVNFIGEIEF